MISAKHLPRPIFQELSDVNETIRSSLNARNIGVIFDNHFHFNAHIASICKSSFYHLRNNSYIRKYQSSNTTEILVHALVSSKLDPCNSLLYGLPNYQIKKLQHVQGDAAARLISLSRKHEHVTPILLNLHWLLINYRIMFKILLITYKALKNLAPSYIRDLLIPYIPSRQLCSSSKHLSIPHFYLRTYDARSFSVAAPTLWNTLPSDIKNSPSVSVFKNRFKTFLFKKAFL